MMKPSRLALNGRDAVSGESLRVDKACIALKPPTPQAAIAASEPPLMMAFALPKRMRLNASAMALVEVAHAEQVA